jgi:hypothetical protein
VSSYLSGGVMLLLLLSFGLIGLQAYDLFDAARAVDAALLDAQGRLAADGGLTPEVERLARERIAAEGRDPARLQIEGSPPHLPYPELVRLALVYEHPYALTLLLPLQSERGIFRVERRATVVSGWRP